MAATYALYYGMTVLSCLFAWLGDRFRDSCWQIRFRRTDSAGWKLSRLTVFLLLAALPMILVSGFRWNTGVDSQNYFWVYSNILYGLNTHVEVGFYLLCRLLLLVTEDVSVLFLVCAVITVSLVMVAIRSSSPNCFLSVFLFITMGYFFYSMNSIRHYMALAIFLFAFRFLRQKKILPYMAFILLAASFHKVALIAIPLYFLFTIKWKYWWYIIGGLLLALVSLFHRQILDFIYQFVYGFYQNIESDYVAVSWWNIFVTLALSVLAFVYRKPLLERNPNNIVLMNAAWFGCLFFALCSWIPDYSRIGQYCVILIIFLVPEILAVETRPLLRRVYYVGIVAGGLLFMGIMIWQAQDPHLALAPYQSLLTRDSYPLHRFWF